MSKQTSLLFSVIIVLMAAGCSASKKSTMEVIASWVNKEVVDSL